MRTPPPTSKGHRCEHWPGWIMLRHARHGHAGCRQLPAARHRRLPRHTGHRQLQVEQQLLAARGGGHQQGTQGTRAQGTWQLPTARRRRVPARCTVLQRALAATSSKVPVATSKERCALMHRLGHRQLQLQGTGAATARYTGHRQLPAARYRRLPARYVGHWCTVHWYTVHRQRARMRHRV